ncbi:hypothetical protein MtrunA17_Chr1g0148591 [Medicago truncatula]|uniref:Transmembrane protein n=1 Tax=Medicago truncatula TaxID=3880 RepID=A0A396JJD3_MEDTR|nr:hypothetical protein MtrunA17_Chr1g0148591 [Medicago truncatula]
MQRKKMVKTLKFVNVIIFFLSLFLSAHNFFLVAQNIDGKVKTLVTLQDFVFFFVLVVVLLRALFFFFFIGLVVRCDSLWLYVVLK